MDLRKIDALVAEHVFGLKVEERVTYGANSADVTVYTIGDVTDPKPYSSDIAAAWEVAEKMTAPGNGLHVNVGKSGDSCYATFERTRYNGEPDDWSAGDQETVPLAICLAALKAKGIAV